MKRIIDGKIYNTDTATLIAEASSHVGRSDFSWWEEELYVTPKGRFFVYGEGHAMSRWAEPVGNMRGPGSGIEALTAAEALEWCERHRIDPDDVSDYLKFEDA